jgi:hypothetical protein
LLATGGDDNALVISTLEVTAGGNGIKSNLAIEVVSQSSLAAAHSSTIQGASLKSASLLKSMIK